MATRYGILCPLQNDAARQTQTHIDIEKCHDHELADEWRKGNFQIYADPHGNVTKTEVEFGDDLSPGISLEIPFSPGHLLTDNISLHHELSTYSALLILMENDAPSIFEWENASHWTQLRSYQALFYYHQ